ncbi:apolipoprotein N-acyltransferase [Caviibacterium pharyngocola]|uniref:Apolipoprotein N-acyltransferase n=1 Tax=Caviibacterium pharyngocola TaxID=28159 RepID=A0A2M8RXA1_9PAST|nr:apolipoprotein N-acyltransferase [Caviibacterium pharyngocola]PJG83515.1 apolipoprotein N-acyltransferase [Caviibacterium pharyngocola]
MNAYLTYLVAALFGASGVLAFSPFDLWGFAYVSLFGLIWIAKNPRKKTALCGAFFWGVAFFSLGVSWLNVSIHQFGGAPLVVSYLLVVLLAAYLSLYPVLFAYFIQRFNVNGLIVFPILWTLTEFLRGWVFTGFPWLQFGYTQIDSPFAGIAPIFGVEGLTFFVMWASAVFFSLVSALFKRPRKFNVAIAHGLLLLIVGGLSSLSSSLNFVKEVEEKGLNITLAQGNIEQNLKWDPDYLYQTLDIYSRLIGQYLGKTDLIILPEAALPTLENHIQPFLEQLNQAAEQQSTEVIIGTVYRDEQQGKLLNSIIDLGDPAQPYQPNTPNRYSKSHLVPFGEYVPLENLLRPLGSVFNLPMSAFQAGDDIQPPFSAKARRFTPAICYEIIFGAQLQRNITPQTDFLLTISNDAWFGDSIGPWQHLQMARMRALEFGKPLIRATNTGISVFIDAKGRIIAQAPQFVETTLTQHIIPTQGKTPYAALGSAPLYLISAILILLRSLGALIKRRLLKSAV